MRSEQALLAEHRQRIEAEIQQLHVVLKLIDTKAAYYDAWQKAKRRHPLHAPLPAGNEARRGH